MYDVRSLSGLLDALPQSFDQGKGEGGVNGAGAVDDDFDWTC